MENGKLSANCRLFDDISGKEIPIKFRKFETLVVEMLTGTNLNPKEFIRRIAIKGQKTPLYLYQQNWQNFFYCVDLKENPSVFVLAKLAKLLLLRGFKDFPWNSARKEFVSLFFNNDVIPYHNPYMKDTLATPADVTPEDAAPEGQVSDNSFSKERKLDISDAKKVKHEQTDPIRTDLMSEVGFNSFMKK